MASLNFQCAFTATSFRRMEHTLKQQNTARGAPQFIPRFLQTEAECRHSLLGQQVRKLPQNLSNAGFFYQGKVQ